MFILDQPIHRSRIFLNADDPGGGGGGGDEPFKIDVTDVPGDVQVDFSDLEKELADKGKIEPPKGHVTTEPVENPENPEAKQKEAKETEPPAQETEAEKEQRVASERARDEKGRFTAKEKEAADKKAAEEAAAKAKETPPTEEKKTEELPSEEEIDKLQPRPGTNPKTQDDFRSMKEATKKAIARAKQAEAALKAHQESQSSGQGKLDPEIEAELKELREHKRMVEAENDPAFQKEYGDKIKTAEDGFFNFLTTHPRLQLKKETADKIREMGIDSEQGRAAIGSLLKKINESGDPLLYSEAMAHIQARSSVVREREQKIQEIRANSENFWKNKQEAEKTNLTQWAGVFDKEFAKASAGENGQPPEWLAFKPVPENATPEQKAAIEAHNKSMEPLQARFKDMVVKIHGRDPKEIASAMFRSFAYEQQEKALKAKEAEVETLKREVDELKAIAKGVKRISEPSRVATTSVTQSNKPAPATSRNGEISADDAVDAYAREKGIRI